MAVVASVLGGVMGVAGQIMQYRAERDNYKQAQAFQAAQQQNVLASFRENVSRGNLQISQERDRMAEERRTQRRAALEGLGVMEVRNSASGARGNSADLALGSVYSDLARQQNIAARNEDALRVREQQMFQDLRTNTNSQLAGVAQPMESPSALAAFTGIAATGLQSFNDISTARANSTSLRAKNALIETNRRRGF